MSNNQEKEFVKKKIEFMDKYPSISVAGIHDFGVINIVNGYANGRYDEIECVNKVITHIDHYASSMKKGMLMKDINKVSKQ